jgi:mRNA-degrading endonuclease YafQ of YafQ-DinJ toxin-antitoxin module
MKKPPGGTEPPRAFEVEFGPSWKKWAKNRKDEEIAELTVRLKLLQENFGKPHLHAGLGLRRLQGNAFEFRLSRDLRVVFLLHKPATIRLMMIGNHDDLYNWLRRL